MVHVSRLAEEIVLWMSQNFGFIDLADRYCTGSSIMPQKRNPDVAELARGKSGRVVGHLMGLLTLMKGQPLAYNKDNQEDKEPLFDTVDTLADTLRIMAEMVAASRSSPLRWSRRARGYATATDLADYLVKKGLPFRDAHEVVAHAVKVGLQQGVDLAELPLDELQALHPLIGDDDRPPRHGRLLRVRRTAALPGTARPAGGHRRRPPPPARVLPDGTAAICHAARLQGRGVITTATYPARAFGVHSGMG
jgi:argininosuccinate lyase